MIPDGWSWLAAKIVCVRATDASRTTSAPPSRGDGLAEQPAKARRRRRRVFTIHQYGAGLLQFRHGHSFHSQAGGLERARVDDLEVAAVHLLERLDDAVDHGRPT